MVTDTIMNGQTDYNSITLLLYLDLIMDATRFLLLYLDLIMHAQRPTE